MAGGKEEYNAFFYSLVSTDTQVMSKIDRDRLAGDTYMLYLNSRFWNVGDVLLN